jgi:hypothetical protein
VAQQLGALARTQDSLRVDASRSATALTLRPRLFSSRGLREAAQHHKVLHVVGLPSKALALATRLRRAGFVAIAHLAVACIPEALES